MTYGSTDRSARPRFDLPIFQLMNKGLRKVWTNLQELEPVIRARRNPGASSRSSAAASSAPHRA